MEIKTYSEYFHQIKQEAQIFSNIVYVLDKIENDGSLNSVSGLLKSILEFEINFATTELTKISEYTENFDTHTQLIKNTLIFKENLKQE